MKSFIITIILGVLLTAGSTFHMHKLKTSAEELIACNNYITERLKADDFENALSSLDTLHKKICGIEPFFATLGEHDRINIIEQTLAELICFTEGRQKYDALSKSYTLTLLLEHLPKDLQLCPENIF